MRRMGSWIVVFVATALVAAPSSAQLLVEGLDDVTTLPGADWVLINHSEPAGSTTWLQGNNGVLPAQAGASTASIAANFNSTAGTGTISNCIGIDTVSYDSTGIFFDGFEPGETSAWSFVLA